MSLLNKFRRPILDRMVLRPSQGPVDSGQQRRVHLNFNGKRLECFVQSFVPNAPSESLRDELDVLVLKFPGTEGRAERSSAFPLGMISQCSPEPISGEVWTWNPPGYGGSEGKAGMGAIADAAVVFYESVVQQRASEHTRVILCGNSLGSVAALNVAARCQPPMTHTGLVLRNPPPLIPVVKRIASRYPMGRLLAPIIESLVDSMNSLITAPRSELPALFLQSELDTLVPLAMQRKVHVAYAGSKRIVTLLRLGHNGTPDESHHAEIAAGIAWLWSELGGASDELEPSRASLDPSASSRAH